jgi:hypothetical protein
MKINNPQRFFVANNETDYLAKKRLSTLMTRGDVIRKYCSSDSSIEADWHAELADADAWIKFSFDGGFTYPLKFKFKNDILVKHEISFETTQIDEFLTIKLDGYTDSLFEEASNGVVSVFFQDADGFLRNVSEFGYKFAADETTLEYNLLIKFFSEIPADAVKAIVSIQVNANNAMALAVATPVYSSQIAAIPSLYDEKLGICNILDESIPQITCNTKFENVNRMAIKVVSADSNVTGNIKLSFTCGSSSWVEIVPVGATEEWFELSLEDRLNGTMVITRIVDDVEDTLKDDDLVISAFITNIKVEII